jgi:peptide/nickel transport system substrate-binding protein
MAPRRYRSRAASAGAHHAAFRRRERQFSAHLFALVGANNDPDVFEFVFSSKRFPPDGANRGHYRNPRIDALVDQIRTKTDREKRKALCREVQKILADDLLYLPLWFTDVVSVHRRSLGDLRLSPTGDFDFLAALQRPAASQWRDGARGLRSDRWSRRL